MHIVSCPHCGLQGPPIRASAVTCPRCRNVTQLLAASDFLAKAEALWGPGIEVTLRGGRAARRIREHDEYLKRRGDYDIITATLDENIADNAGEADADAD